MGLIVVTPRMQNHPQAEAKRKESFDAEGNKQHSNGGWITCTQRYQHDGKS